MAPTINSPDPALASSTGKTAPSIDEDSVNHEPSQTSIRNIPVRNTIAPPKGSIPSLPNKLPFD